VLSISSSPKYGSLVKYLQNGRMHSLYCYIRAKGQDQTVPVTGPYHCHIISVPGNVFAHVILDRLQPLLTKHRRPQQSGFTAGRSTADAILALRLLSELHREFSKPLHVAYVDIKAAFDSVDREALWKALKAKHVPPFLIKLIKDLH